MRAKLSARPASIGARRTDAAEFAADGSPNGGRLGILLAWQINSVVLKSAGLNESWENPNVSWENPETSPDRARITARDRAVAHTSAPQRPIRPLQPFLRL
jgi:hypothetical protein